MSSNPNFFLRVSDAPLGASVAAKKYVYIYIRCKNFQNFYSKLDNLGTVFLAVVVWLQRKLRNQAGQSLRRTLTQRALLKTTFQYLV